MPTGNTLLNMDCISIDFPGVRALDGIDFELNKGEVHALLGENGAGKSTLMNILGGVYSHYQGEIRLDQKPVKFANPKEAIECGIGIIYQELDLVPEFTVGENIFVGDEPITNKLGIFPFLDRRKIFAETRVLLNDLGFFIPPNVKVNTLSVGEQQLVQIAKAVRLSAKVLVMDEPTARLAYHEANTLFKIIDKLKKRGVSIIYISHYMEEVFRVADRMTVLRDHKLVGTVEKNKTSMQEIIHMLVGRELIEETGPLRDCNEKELFRVEGLELNGLLHDVNFRLAEGEILGIGGLVGSGRSTLAHCIAGAQKRTRGDIFINERKTRINSPKTAIKAGVVLIPEERKSQGLILNQSIQYNLTLTALRNISKFQLINLHKREAFTNEMMNSLGLTANNPQQMVMELSGGNQQKVVVGKWLLMRPKILILDQPTRGIDIGAKKEIYDLIVELAKGGTGIILISDELDELNGLCDRILILRNGRISKEFQREKTSRAELLSAIISSDADS